ncbi:hypothetical protein ACIOYV_13815 [Pseudomonas sp. NPDC087342]|uniref:hypothetical protein n=1 Tax=Pseudomonas sp. NPDC087342 TaxID=3364437 RepID=UPI00380B901F
MSDQPDEAEPPVEQLAETDPQLRPLKNPVTGRAIAQELFLVVGPDGQSDGDRSVEVHYYSVRHGFMFSQTADITKKPFEVSVRQLLPEGECYIHYRYRTSVWSYWYYSGRFYVMWPARITPPSSSISYDPNPVLSGSGQPGTYVQLYRLRSSGEVDTVISTDMLIPPNGGWSLRVNFNLLEGDNRIVAWQWVLGTQYGLMSAETTIVYFRRPVITAPTANQIVASHQIVFKGTGHPTSTITVVNAANHYDAISESTTVAASRAWEARAKASPLRSSGVLTVEAQYQMTGVPHGYSPALTFKVLGIPTLTTAASEQETTFNLTGANGLSGSIVNIYIDRSTTKVGQSGVLTGATWSGTVTLPPGPAGLVAEQSQAGVTSERSAPILFKIRPQKLTTVTVTPLPNQQVRLSGNGFNGATVEFSYVSGPGSPPVPPAPVATGNWQTTVTNWTPGSYTFSATQKVSDGAGGWISSLPYQFTFTWAMPDPTDVTYSVADYTPTFSGNGYTGATVLIKKQGGAEAAPDATVVNGRWSSKSAQVWGPTLKQLVHLKQRLGGQESANWVEISVTITPLAPVITSLVDNEMSPTLSGTCWPGAEVNLVFSDNATVNRAVVTNGTWTYRRTTPFAADVVHTVTVTQTAATLKSPPTQRTFSVFKTLHQPVITPPPAPEVGRDLTVRGTQGVAGATMQLRDAQFQLPLGPAKPLTRDGDWDIALAGLEFREYTIDAQQTLGVQASERSDMHTFKVVVLPPDIQVPAPGGDLPRTATISGTGMPGAVVDVWLQGQAQPVLSGLPVRSDGHWEGNVTLDIGHQTLWATQIFDNKLSRDSPPQTVRVVPAAPYIETPAANELVGRRTVVSGFGYPGDRVAVAFAHTPLEELARGLVLDDRTWSVVVNLTHSSGNTALIAVQWRQAFNSGASARREIQLGTYLPGITAPAPGQWVTHPVGFAGTGLSGSGSVSSWFNPDLKWQVNIGVPGGRWQGTANTPLPQGGNWVRFQQTIVDSPRPTTPSDSVESERFEVAQGDRP